MIASLEAGDLKGKRIGSQWRITRTAITDFLNGATTNVCAAAIGTVLAPGASLATPCKFTAAAPAAGTNQPDVAIVTVVDTNDPANFASDSDTANVTRPV